MLRVLVEDLGALVEPVSAGHPEVIPPRVVDDVK
jgi:hypothetical protein